MLAKRAANISSRAKRRHIDKIKIASVYTEVVLVKKKGREISAISRPFPVGRYFDFYAALSQIHFSRFLLFFIRFINIVSRNGYERCKEGAGDKSADKCAAALISAKDIETYHYRQQKSQENNASAHP